MAEFNLKLLDSEINDFRSKFTPESGTSSTFLAEIVSGIVEHILSEHHDGQDRSTGFGRMD